MTANDTLRELVEFCHMLAGAYIGDLSDSELLVRSVPGTNHIAWQLGHCISSDHGILTALGHQPPELPPGFAEAYTKETAASDDPARFATKDEYLGLAARMKEAVLAAIAVTPADDLEKPGPESMREYAPTVGSALGLLGTHWLMHSGQWVPIRRKLGKPPLF